MTNSLEAPVPDPTPDPVLDAGTYTSIREPRSARRLPLGDGDVAGEIGRLGPQIALFQGGDGLPHQRGRDPSSALDRDDRAVVGAIRRETALAHRAIGPAETHRHHLRRDVSAGLAVAIRIAPAAPRDPFGEFIDIVDGRRGVHPPGLRVEALIDEELTPGACAYASSPSALVICASDRK